MNKLYFLILFALLGCGKDENPGPTPVTFEWSAGYPEIAYGAVSVDLNIQTDKASKVYWIVATKALSLNAEEVKAQATKPDVTGIKFHGIIEAEASVNKRETIESLTQNAKYFVYMVGEDKVDARSQTRLTQWNFTTYYRQDTSEFHSIVESRTALYLIYRPEKFLKYPDEKYPILFFLGGNGEVAKEGKPINFFNGNGTVPEYIKKGNDVPMIVMSIQHTIKDWNPEFIDEAVDYGLSNYNVDRNKVYMTGISSGSFACWDYAFDHANKLTAIVPISGGGDVTKACNLNKLAIWAFHNLIDNTINSSFSINMINAVNLCPPEKEVKLLTFPDAGHNCWRRVYDQNHKDWDKSPEVSKFDLYAWLLTNSK